jgi:transcriptional regulator with XRE-family HTH domain
MGKAKKVKDEEWILLISERLKQLRKEKGYSSYETFALDHGLDRKQYWRVENGANITLKTLIKILAAHKRELPSFFREIELYRKIS